MKKYVITSNQFNHLLPMYSLFFNKYWPDQQITILCYDIPKIILPNNFELISIGKQKQNLEPLVRYFKYQCKEDYFLLLLEDLFLVDYVDQNKVNLLEQEICLGADKASLHSYRANEIKYLNNNIVELKQDVNYRTSVQPSIWTKKYLLKHLHPNHNWWSFEMQHENTKNDGAKIVYLKEQLMNMLFSTTNIYVKGKLSKDTFQIRTRWDGDGVVYKEDIIILKQLKQHV